MVFIGKLIGKQDIWNDIGNNNNESIKYVKYGFSTFFIKLKK